MTTLARMLGARGAVSDRQVGPPPDGARVLLNRLREESDRQVPFSQAKVLLREAASAIERLEAQLAKVTADLEQERAARQAPSQAARSVVEHNAQ